MPSTSWTAAISKELKGTVIYSRNCQDVRLSLLIIFLHATYFLTGYQLPEKYSYRDLTIACLSSILTWSVRKWVWIKRFETYNNKTRILIWKKNFRKCFKRKTNISPWRGNGLCRVSELRRYLNLERRKNWMKETKWSLMIAYFKVRKPKCHILVVLSTQSADILLSQLQPRSYYCSIL